MVFKKIKAALMTAAIFALLPLNALGQANTYYDKGNTTTGTTGQRIFPVGNTVC